MLMPNIPPKWMYDLAKNARNKVLTKYMSEGLNYKDAKNRLALTLPWNSAMSYAKNVRKGILEQVFGQVEHSEEIADITHRTAPDERRRKVRETVIPRQQQPTREYPDRFTEDDLGEVTGLDKFKRPLTSQRQGTGNITDVVSKLPEKDVEYKFKFELPPVPGLKENPFSEDDMSIVALMNPPEKNNPLYDNPLYDNPSAAAVYRKLLYDQKRQEQGLAKRRAKDTTADALVREKALQKIKDELPKKKAAGSFKSVIASIAKDSGASQAKTKEILDRFFYGLPGHKEVKPEKRGRKFVEKYYRKFPHVRAGILPEHLKKWMFTKQFGIKTKTSKEKELLEKLPKEKELLEKLPNLQDLLEVGYSLEIAKELLKLPAGEFTDAERELQMKKLFPKRLRKKIKAEIEKVTGMIEEKSASEEPIQIEEKPIQSEY